MDEDIPLPVDLPAAELNWAQCRVPGFQAVLTAFEGGPHRLAKSGTPLFHPTERRKPKADIPPRSTRHCGLHRLHHGLEDVGTDLLSHLAASDSREAVVKARADPGV